MFAQALFRDAENVGFGFLGRATLSGYQNSTLWQENALLKSDSRYKSSADSLTVGKLFLLSTLL